MKARHMLARGLLFFGILLTAIPLEAGASKSVSSMWKPPDGWTMEMEQFSPTEPNEVGPARYVLRVLVTGKSTIAGVDCWNVGFLSGEQTPPRVEGQYSVSVAKDAGWPLKIIHSRVLKRVPEPVLAASALGLAHPLNSLGIVGATPSLKVGYIKPTEQINCLERFGTAGFITSAPQGFPIEIFPLYEPGEFASAKSGATLTLRSRKEGGFLVLEAAVKMEGKDKVLIRQKWIEGEKWWREYERYVDGRKDLQARQVIPLSVKAESPGDPTRPDPYYLRRDPKLQAIIEIEWKVAKLPVVLERIHKATGLLLTLDAGLTHHQPDLGAIQPSKQACRACDLMGIIERAQLENGRWVKTPKGYELTGISKLPTLVKLPGEGVLPEPDARSGGVSPWLIAGGAALGIALLGLGTFLFFRRPRRSVADGSRKSPKTRGGLR